MSGQARGMLSLYVMFIRSGLRSDDVANLRNVYMLMLCVYIICFVDMLYVSRTLVQCWAGPNAGLRSGVGRGPM